MLGNSHEIPCQYPGMLDCGHDTPVRKSKGTEMKTISSSDADADINFTVLCDMEYDRIAEYHYTYAADGSAPEIALIKVADKSDVATLMTKLKDHVKDRQGAMAEYSPEQVEQTDYPRGWAECNHSRRAWVWKRRCACWTRYARSVVKSTLSRGSTRPKSFGASVRAPARRILHESLSRQLLLQSPVR